MRLRWMISAETALNLVSLQGASLRFSCRHEPSLELNPTWVEPLPNDSRRWIAQARPHQRGAAANAQHPAPWSGAATLKESVRAGLSALTLAVERLGERMWRERRLQRPRATTNLPKERRQKYDWRPSASS